MCVPQLLTGWYLLTIYLNNNKVANEIVDMIPCYIIFTERSQTNKFSLPVTKQPCCQSVSPSVVRHADITVCSMSKRKPLRIVQQLLLLYNIFLNCYHYELVMQMWEHLAFVVTTLLYFNCYFCNVDFQLFYW